MSLFQPHVSRWASFYPHLPASPRPRSPGSSGAHWVSPSLCAPASQSWQEVGVWVAQFKAVSTLGPFHWDRAQAGLPRPHPSGWRGSRPLGESTSLSQVDWWQFMETFSNNSVKRVAPLYLHSILLRHFYLTFRTLVSSGPFVSLLNRSSLREKSPESIILSLPPVPSTRWYSVVWLLILG